MGVLTSEEAEFVAQSVRLMVGIQARAFLQTDAALVRALAGSSKGAVGFRPGSREALHLVDGALKPETRRFADPRSRVRPAASLVWAFNTRSGFVVDMWDRRLRSVSDTDQPPYPVFSFNRLTGEGGRLLWPLAGYHDLDGPGFLGNLDPGAVAWGDKIPRAVWRGGTGCQYHGRGSGRSEGMRVLSAVRRYRAGKLGQDRMERVVRGAPRWQVLDRVKDDARFDLGFVDSADFIIADTPLHAHLERPRLTLRNMQEFRYICVLRGNDVGSSFYWTMNSGSVGLVQDTPYETFASGHFRPWVHYIPFAADGSDLVARFEWAEEHQAECRDMVRRAAAICRLLARADLRALILNEVAQYITAG